MEVLPEFVLTGVTVGFGWSIDIDDFDVESVDVKGDGDDSFCDVFHVNNFKFITTSDKNTYTIYARFRLIPQ